MKRRGFLGSLLGLSAIGVAAPAGSLATLSTRLLRSSTPLPPMPTMTGTWDTFRTGDIITIGPTSTGGAAKYRIMASVKTT